MICIAVRMKSTRCPEKAMADLYGKPLIDRLIERIRDILPVCICTSINPQDDVLERPGIPFMRGSELDVSSRFLQAAYKYKVETIVRVTGDNPLTDPDLIREMWRNHHTNHSDYTYCKDVPRGTKPEIIQVEALRDLYRQQDPDKSEYMSHDLMLLPNRREYKTGIDRPDVRLTVDTPEDLKRVQALYKDFQGKPPAIPGLIEWYDVYQA